MKTELDDIYRQLEEIKSLLTVIARGTTPTAFKMQEPKKDESTV